MSVQPCPALWRNGLALYGHIYDGTGVPRGQRSLVRGEGAFSALVRMSLPGGGCDTGCALRSTRSYAQSKFKPNKFPGVAPASAWIPLPPLSHLSPALFGAAPAVAFPSAMPSTSTLKINFLLDHLKPQLSELTQIVANLCLRSRWLCYLAWVEDISRRVLGQVVKRPRGDQLRIKTVETLPQPQSSTCFAILLPRASSIEASDCENGEGRAGIPNRSVFIPTR